MAQITRAAQNTRELHGRVIGGRHRIYLGWAPGVGTTYAMLRDATMLYAQGVDVLIGLVETHGRAATAAQIGTLPQIPRRSIAHKRIMVEDLNLPSLLERHPQVVLVDDLAHTNVPGAEHVKRYQDTEALLKAGISVFSTLNIQHLERLNDSVYELTGMRMRETVPDRLLEQADEIVFVDLDPGDLIARLEAGQMYPSERAARAQQHVFRPDTLTALRELALRRVVSTLDERLTMALPTSGLAGPAPSDARVLVVIGPTPSAARLVSSAWDLAASMRGDVIVVHVQLRVYTTAETRMVQETFRLAQQLGAQVIDQAGTDAIQDVARLARELRINHLVVEQPTRRRWWGRWRGTLADHLKRHLPEVALHLVATDAKAF